MTQFKVKQKEERESFLTRVKTVETEVEYAKGNTEYLRKIIQQHKFFGGCYAMPMMPPSQQQTITGGSTIIAGGTATTGIDASLDNSIILLTQEGFTYGAQGGLMASTQRSTMCGPSCGLNCTTGGGGGGFGASSLMQPTLPVQLTQLGNRISSLQTELEDLSKFTKEKVGRINHDVDDLR